MKLRATAIAAMAVAAISCRPSGPPPAIPAAMAACVPNGAILIAGARLDALRASPLYSRLPQSFTEPFRDASQLMAVFNGTDLLFIALNGSGRVSLSGSQPLVQAAEAQRRTGGPGSADLLAQASAAATGQALWIATRGQINLPLTGDAANINRLLRLAEFATLGLSLDSPARLNFAAQCASPDLAQHLEESLRGFLSLSVLGVARRPQLAAVLRSADVRRQGNHVRATLTAPSSDLPQLFDYFSR